MGFLDAVSLLVVFSLCLLIQIEAVPTNRENITANGNVTLNHASSNVTGGSTNHSDSLKNLNPTMEMQNHTISKNESRIQPTHNQTALPGQETYSEIFNDILQTLQLEHGIKAQDLHVLLRKLGICSRDATKVKTISDVFMFYYISFAIFDAKKLALFIITHDDYLYC